MAKQTIRSFELELRATKSKVTMLEDLRSSVVKERDAANEALKSWTTTRKALIAGLEGERADLMARVQRIDARIQALTPPATKGVDSAAQVKSYVFDQIWKVVSE